MAHSPQGRRLTEEHRQAQVGLNRRLTSVLGELFRACFNWSDIDQSMLLFVRKAVPLVMESRGLSQVMAEAYLERFRQAELEYLLRGRPQVPQSPPEPGVARTVADVLRDGVTVELLSQVVDAPQPVTVDVAAGLPDAGEVAESLWSSSAGVLKQAAGQGRGADEAAARAEQAVKAKATRIVADGGRAPLMDEVQHGRNGAVGYARVVDADPCPFCAMLASRGAVYRSDSFAESNALFAGDSGFKVHDGCECTLEPVYGRSASHLPPGSAELARQWADIAAGEKDPWGVWRRWRESGTLPGQERRDVTRPSVFSAPQHGRAGRGPTQRRQIEEITDRDELERVLHGMKIRRHGMRDELDALAQRGQSPDEPGPAREIKRRLDRLEEQIAEAERRLA